MGILQNVLGLGHVARDVGGAIRENTEVFKVNETEAMKQNAEDFRAVLAQFEAEFEHAPVGVFSQSIDGLNRLPRPLFALGTVGLFGFALWDPDRFSARMIGLQEVPDPLWWLLGAIVSFYFGARELHYLRQNRKTRKIPQGKIDKAPQDLAVHSSSSPQSSPQSSRAGTVAKASKPNWVLPQTSDNAAIRDWLKSQRE